MYAGSLLYVVPEVSVSSAFMSECEVQALSPVLLTVTGTATSSLPGVTVTPRSFDRVTIGVPAVTFRDGRLARPGTETVVPIGLRGCHHPMGRVRAELTEPGGQVELEGERGHDRERPDHGDDAHRPGHRGSWQPLGSAWPALGSRTASGASPA